MDIDHNFNSIGWPDQVDRVQIFEFQILADSINGQDHLDRVQRYGSPPLNFEFSKLGAEVGHPTVLLCPPLSFFCTICVSPLQRFLYLLLPLSFPITHFFLLQPPISYPFLLYKLENTSLSLSHYSFPLLTTRNRLSLSLVLLSLLSINLSGFLLILSKPLRFLPLFILLSRCTLGHLLDCSFIEQGLISVYSSLSMFV